MTSNPPSGAALWPAPRAPESPTERLDRLLHAAAAPLTRGLSPVSLGLAWADWAWHLALCPGRQMDLAALALRLAHESGAAPDATATEPAGSADEDPRFRHKAWTTWPFNVLRHAFRQQEAFWREAAQMPGMTAHHAAITQFFARQWLGMLTPANGLFTNPVVLRDAFDSGGAHLTQGALHWLRDVTGQPDPDAAAQAAHYVVGRDVAVTPGKVVWRNALIELIRYAPQTKAVHPEPLLIVPSWIMKYYILDLSPPNSLARYLVARGHTVYMLSWRNPDASDRELSMDDYLHLGVFDALRAVARGHRLPDGTARPVHAMGYCLGGTLLAIGAAALARNGNGNGNGNGKSKGEGQGKGNNGALGGRHAVPPLASLTLLGAQTDFSEPGELGLFIDASQVRYLDEITRGPGYLSGAQMAGSFQFLHSRELVWTRRMREYLMGEREQRTDLMAWNADTTRLPARMHHEYLSTLYLHNALANGRYRVRGHTLSLADLGKLPLFMVGTERDHVSPWRSVYKLHRLCDAEITFVLASGGHNAGIVSEPGHPNHYYRIACRPAGAASVAPEEWQRIAVHHTGSWWPAWHGWLAARSSAQAPAEPIAPQSALADAPGEYVRQRYDD